MVARDNPIAESKTTRSAVMSIFSNQQVADAALDDLRGCGFAADQLSIVTKEMRGTHPTVEDQEPSVAQEQAYTEQVNQGGVLLRVNAFSEEQTEQARAILVAHGGSEVRTYAAGTGSTRAAPAIPADYYPAGSDVSAVDYRPDEE
jgi:hypothetical protein